MKKRISLFLVFCVIISMASAVSVSAWSNGPAIKNTGATSDDYDYEPELAFDDDPETFWHSEWRGENDEGYTAKDEFPQTLIVELDNTYWIDCIGYLPRSDTSRNGSALELEVWVSVAGAATDFDNDAGWTKVAAGTWDEDHWNGWKENWDDTEEVVFSNLEFPAAEAKFVKIKLMDGMGGWACCAALELGFLGVNYTPMEGFVPKSAPGSPAPEPEPEPEPAAPEPAADDGASADVPASEPVTAPAPATPSPVTSDINIIVFGIMFVTALALISYKTIFAKNS